MALALIRFPGICLLFFLLGLVRPEHQGFLVANRSPNLYTSTFPKSEELEEQTRRTDDATMTISVLRNLLSKQELPGRDGVGF